MKKVKILIIDDDETFTFFVKKNLTSQKDYEVSTTADPQNALRAIKEDNPDVLLLDIRMPKIDGLEIAKSIRKFNSSIKIIFITGFKSFELQKQASQYDISDYITKPASAAEIIKVIEQALQ